MATKRKAAAPTAQTIASYVRQNAAGTKKAQKQTHGGMDSVREADYEGHHIVVRTRYSIEVDGRMLMGHMGVTNDGQVHYHPVPNLSFASAIDLVKQLIDIFPDDFTGKTRGGTGGMHDMHGMAMGKSNKKSK